MAPKSVLILGGNGKVARHITTQLLSTSPKPTIYSVIRNPAQSDDLKHLGAHPIVQDIETSSSADFAKLISTHKPAVVIWAAGATGGDADRADAVDYKGAVKVIEAITHSAKEHDTTKRYVTVSALDVRDRENKPVPDWYNDDDKKMSDRVWKVIKPYLEAKYKADKTLVEDNGERGLAYTIVRPGGLSQDEGTGKVSAGKVRLGKMVSREDVASTVIAALGNDETVGLAFDVAGGEEKVVEAVKQVGKDKTDTFEGYH